MFVCEVIKLAYGLFYANIILRVMQFHKTCLNCLLFLFTLKISNTTLSTSIHLLRNLHGEQLFHYLCDSLNPVVSGAQKCQHICKSYVK